MSVIRLRAPMAAALCAFFAIGAASALSAQGRELSATSAAGEQRKVEGRVLQPRKLVDTVAPSPVPNVMVTLHRVGSDTAGPLDSVRTDNRGAYRFSYRTVGTDAVYFASVTYGGIAYFTAPFRTAVVNGEDAEITVFDTTSTVTPLGVRGRHLIVGAIDSTDSRTIIEVFELENEQIRTLISFDTVARIPTWSVAVPSAARSMRVNEAEVSADAFVHRDGRVSLYSPFGPGLKQVSFSYRIPAQDFPVAYTLEDSVNVFEVLLEDTRGTVSNEHLTAVGNVNLEGRNFRRFLGQNMEAGERVIVELSSSRPISGNLYIASLLIVIGAAMLLMLSRAMSRRAPATTSAQIGVVQPALPVQEQLAREIAALDEIFARTANPSDEVRDAYEKRRSELRDALAGALAESGAPR